MKKTIHHIRHHAQKHHEAHIKLKDLLSRPFQKEKVWHIFVSTFFIVLISITIFMSWGQIVNFFKPDVPASLPQVHGFQSGILSMYKIEDQIFNTHQKYIAQIPASGSLLGLQTSQLVSKEKERQIIKFEENSLKNSIWLSNKLGTGQHLTKLDQNRAKALQKSILATFYFGEKTIDINSTLQSDSQILSQINNALSVDLFQFLNQSSSRADTLDGYINLLEILLGKSNERIFDLQSKINFLKTNFSLKEQQIKLSEDIFFENLKIFDGPEAEKDLAQFIGLQESQVEVRAKIGTYETLQGYYKFFQPKLDNLIQAIKVNRGPLIAGVKVVEIQNMSLPLIIKQR